MTQAQELQQLAASLSGEAGAIRRRLGGEASLQALLGQLRAKEEEAAEKLRDLSAYMDDTSARWAPDVAAVMVAPVVLCHSELAMAVRSGYRHQPHLVIIQPSNLHIT